MHKLFEKFVAIGSRARFGIFVFMFVMIARGPAMAAEITGAHVSQVIQDVRLLGSNAAPRPAAVNDNVGDGMAVRTGAASRAELTFSDLTITRLGENTVFSFKAATRELNLANGAVLVQVPKKGADAHITTTVATAAVSGGTGLFEFNKGVPAKLLILEGSGRLCSESHPDECEIVHGGEMGMVSVDGHLTQPTKFNAERVYKTSKLIVGFRPLPNEDLILATIDDQSLATISSSPPPSKDIVDVVDQSTVASSSPSPAPTGTPSEFGPPPTVTSPNPYVITGGTQIQMDPSITTNGVTNFGTLYRDATQDGTVPQFLYGSTRPFDAQVFEAGGNTDGPYAVFKFSNLQLVGNPTISTINGGATNLALVSVGDITSGAPGGTITFAGLQNIFIGTQDGSITLGPELTFSGVSKLQFYARGDGSALTLASPISDVTKLRLYAEGTIQVNADENVENFKAISGGDFLSGTGAITAQTIDIESLSNINIDSRQFPNPTGDVTFIAGGTLNATLHPGSDGTTHFTGTSLTAQGTTINVQSTLNPTTFDLGTAAVSFTAGSGGIQAPDILFANGGSLVLQTSNGGNINIYGFESPATATNSDGNVSIFAGQAINVTNDLDIERTNGGPTSGLNVTLNAGTDLSVGGNLSVSTDLSNLTTGANIGITAGGNFTVGGSLSLQTSANAQSGDGANINVDVGGSLNAGNLFFGAEFAVGFAQGNGENVTLDVAKDLIVHNTDNSGGIDLEVITPVQESVGAGANLTLSVGGNLVTDQGGDTTLFVNNDINHVVNGANIAATITGNLNTDNLRVNLLNSGGEIDTGGNLNLDVSGNITTQGDATVEILNNGGTLGSGASLTVMANNVSVGGNLAALIDNSSGGQIGSAATINYDISGNATVANDATFEILGSDGVASGAAINFNGGNYDVGGSFLATIDGDGAITFNNANIRADIVKIGVFGTNGTLMIGGGAISANTLLKLYAPGSNGSIDFTANVTLNSASTAAIIAANKVTIFNGVTVTIGGSIPASVFTNIPNYTGSGGNGSTTGMFGGAGATTQALSKAPAFGSASSSDASTATLQSQSPSKSQVSSAGSAGGQKSGHLTSGKTSVVAMNVTDSGQLLSLLDAAAPGPGGKVTVPASKSTNRSRNSINAGGRVKSDRGASDIQGGVKKPVLLSSAPSFHRAAF
jgi:FecR protein